MQYQYDVHNIIFCEQVIFTWLNLKSVLFLNSMNIQIIYNFLWTFLFKQLQYEIKSELIYLKLIYFYCTGHSEDLTHIRVVELEHDITGSLGLSIAGGIGSSIGDTAVIIANMTPAGPAAKSQKLKVQPRYNVYLKIYVTNK